MMTDPRLCVHKRDTAHRSDGRVIAVPALVVLTIGSIVAGAAGQGLADPDALDVRLALRSSVEFGHAEIASVDPASGLVLCTGKRGVAVMKLGEDGALAIERVVDVAAGAGLPASIDGEISHVACDPRGRGVAAACVIPSDRAGVQGRVVFFRPESGEILSSVLVGFNPDSLSFTPDGSRVCVANEGEPGVQADGVPCDPPGSISVIATAGPKDAAAFRTVGQPNVVTAYFSGEAFEKVMSESDPSRRLRIHPLRRSAAPLDIEPECVTTDNEHAYVTLQENNGIAVFDFATTRWSLIRSLGFTPRVIDPSDKDGGANVSMAISAMPMPDQLARFEVGGRAYLVTADEGDDRGEWESSKAPLGDSARLKRLGELAMLSPATAKAAQSGDRGPGRLKVCAFSGDLDGDGMIEHPAILGARSISVWDAATLEHVGDSGSLIEQGIATWFPAQFNADSVAGSPPDSQSDTRGPEPEGITTGVLDGRTYAFVTLERPGGVAAFDVSDPVTPRLAGLVMTAGEGYLAPEGIVFLDAAKSPTGKAALVVAYEVSGRVVVFDVVIAKK
ncbi:MAG TPA: choice-of-anchor I family protein [Phycisphaerales bacterium]|nr:choice-of-anchor I family protein [Phycisphaerales bacterium]